MNKKILLALAGIVLSLGSSKALQAQEVSAGFDVGYRQTTDHWKSGDNGLFDVKVKDMKHLLLKAHAEALFDNQFCVGGELRYGFAMGKAKATGNGTDVSNSAYPKSKIDDKGKHKTNVFEGDIAIGYHIAVADGFSVVPIIGYEFQKYSKKIYAPFTNTAHSPFAGLKLILKPSDECTFRAKMTYGWPKCEFDEKILGHQIKISKQRFHNWKANVGFDYALDEEWDISFDVNFDQKKLKHKKGDLFIDTVKFAGGKQKNKISSWDATIGATYRF